MRDRESGEVARATTIVRYAPGSRSSSHVHGGGEEFFVLEGTFADEHGVNHKRVERIWQREGLKVPRK